MAWREQEHSCLPLISYYIDSYFFVQDYQKKNWDAPKNLAITQAENIIKEGETSIQQQDGQKILFDAKKVSTCIIFENKCD